MAVSATYKYLRKCKLCMHYEVYQCPEQNLPIPPTYFDNGHYPPGDHGVPKHLRAQLRQHLNRARAGPAGAAAEDQNLEDAAPPNPAAGDPNLADAAPPNLGLTSTVTEHFETFYAMSTALLQQNAVLIGQNKDMLTQNATLIEQNVTLFDQNKDVLTQSAELLTQSTILSNQIHVLNLSMAHSEEAWQAAQSRLSSRSEEAASNTASSDPDGVLVNANSEYYEPSGLPVQ